jgi:hypothetical protein
MYVCPRQLDYVPGCRSSITFVMRGPVIHENMLKSVCYALITFEPRRKRDSRARVFTGIGSLFGGLFTS